MTSESSATRLGDHVVLQRGTTYKSALLGQPGPYLLGLASIERDGGFRRDRLRTYGGESPEKLLLRPGDLYVSLKDVTQSGDLLGAVARVPPDIHLGRLTQDTVKLEIGDGGPPADYIYWLLRTPQYREYCRAHSMGTTNLSLSRADFLALPVPKMTPSRASLLAVLQALDDKIDSNRRLAGLLEETAATLFRARFVDFVGIEEFEGSEIGPVPKRWRVGVLADLVEVTMGQSPPGVSYSGDPSDGLLLVQGMGGFGERYPTTQIYTTAPTKRARPGATLMTVRAPVGAVNVARTELCLGRGVAGIDSDHLAFAEFLIRSLRGRWASEESGTIFPAVNRRQILGLRLAIPPLEEICEFDAFAAPIVRLLAGLHDEGESLARLRDCLLPKLISGQIRVPDTADPPEVIEPAAAALAASS